MAEKDLQPLLDTQQNHLGAILAQGESIDNRTLGLLAADITILIFIGQATFVLAWWQWGALLVPFAASLALVVSSLRPRAYVGVAVDPKRLVKYSAFSKEQLVLQLLADTEYAIGHNKQIVARQSVTLIYSFITALLGVVVLLWVVAVQ